MADFRQRDAALYVSSIRETTFNTPVTAGASFLRARSTNPIVLIPVMSKRNDANRAGNPSEFPTVQYNEYWEALAASLTDEASFDLIGRLGLRSVGGSVNTSTVVAAAAFKHAANMMNLAAGLELPAMTLISELGGASFLFPGCKVERFRLSQEGVSPVQAQVDFIGSGKHRSPHAVVTLPSAPPSGIQQIKPFLEYNDGALKDIAGSCRLRNWSVEIVNNHAPTEDRCTGDATQIAGDYATATGASAAAYISKLTRGDRAISAQFSVLLDSTLPEWLQMANNTVLTNFTFGARGAILDATGPTYEAVKVVIPNARFSAVQEQDSNGKAALTFTLQAMHDNAAQGAYVEVINNIATNFL